MTNNHQNLNQYSNSAIQSSINSSAAVIVASILAIGLIISAFILGSQFKNLKQTGSITVKGLAEAPYQANLAQMQFGINSHGNDYAEALERGQQDFQALQEFVKQQGFAINQQHSTPIDVSIHYEDYVDEHGISRSRQDGYTATQSLSIVKEG